MDTIRFGRTNLQVSVVGLGAGGPSRLGQSTGRSKEESLAVVRRALELGITYFDTAEAYGTEEIIGEALRDVPREQVFISTKKGPRRKGELVSPEAYAQGVEACLRRLGTDYVDVFHIHGLKPPDYAYARDALVPVLKRFQEQGKVRFLAVSEHFGTDLEHHMLQQALADDLFDVVMVGFNILNQSARETVFPRTQAQDVATECMFAVRRAFSRPERLREILSELVERGEVDPGDVDLENPLAFAVEESDAHSLTEVAYRFCRYEPGLDVILTGTGNVAHLEENVRALLRPPLPEEVTQRLRRIFARVRSVSGG
ncbi:MAG: aldo/keto reductase [Caldilineae bacterium]|nr:MAG: aldo/keto reductase [Caldilineae bacterium]